MLGEDEDFLHECSIEMFPEDGCLSAYDTFPASELTEHIVLFTEDGIDNHKAGYDLLDKLREELNIVPPFIIYAGWNAPSPAEAKQRGAFGSTSDPQELLQLVSRAVQNVRNI